MEARQQRAERRTRRQQDLAARTAAGRDAPWRRTWRRLRRRAGDLLLAGLGPVALRLLAWSWRVERRGEAGLATLRGPDAWVLVLWHGRLLAPLPLWPHKGRGIGVLVSPSDDGALVGRMLAHFRYHVIRGSTSRRSAAAMREMAGELAAGVPVVITPDGPRGPRHTMNSGACWLARARNAPLLTVAVAVDRAWRLRSWDRFTIPKPFARIVVTYGDPVTIAAEAGDDEVERIAAAARARLLADERAGFAALGVPDDHDPR